MSQMMAEWTDNVKILVGALARIFLGAIVKTSRHQVWHRHAMKGSATLENPWMGLGKRPHSSVPGQPRICTKTRQRHPPSNLRSASPTSSSPLSTLVARRRNLFETVLPTLNNTSFRKMYTTAKMKNVNVARPPKPRTEFSTRRIRESLLRKAYSVSLDDSTS